MIGCHFGSSACARGGRRAEVIRFCAEDDCKQRPKAIIFYARGTTAVGLTKVPVSEFSSLVGEPPR